MEEETNQEDRRFVRFDDTPDSEQNEEDESDIPEDEQNEDDESDIPEDEQNDEDEKPYAISNVGDITINLTICTECSAGLTLKKSAGIIANHGCGHIFHWECFNAIKTKPCPARNCGKKISASVSLGLTTFPFKTSTASSLEIKRLNEIIDELKTNTTKNDIERTSVETQTDANETMTGKQLEIQQLNETIKTKNEEIIELKKQIDELTIGKPTLKRKRTDVGNDSDSESIKKSRKDISDDEELQIVLPVNRSNFYKWLRMNNSSPHSELPVNNTVSLAHEKDIGYVSVYTKPSKKRGNLTPVFFLSGFMCIGTGIVNDIVKQATRNDKDYTDDWVSNDFGGSFVSNNKIIGNIDRYFRKVPPHIFINLSDHDIEKEPMEKLEEYSIRIIEELLYRGATYIHIAPVPANRKMNNYEKRLRYREYLKKMVFALNSDYPDRTYYDTDAENLFDMIPPYREEKEHSPTYHFQLCLEYVVDLIPKFNMKSYGF